MSFRMHDKHWQIIINVMEDHPEVATGKFVGPTGKENYKKFWKELTIQLNAAGFGEKTWTDYKYNLKKKASNHKRDMLATGGGPSTVPKLTEMELKLLAILGNTFHEGLNITESGVNLDMLLTFIFMSGSAGTKRNSNVEENEAVASTSTVEFANNTMKENLEITDHTYTVPQPHYGKRQRKNTESSDLVTLSQETLVKLKEIRTVLNSKLINLTDAVNNLTKVLKERNSNL